MTRPGIITMLTVALGILLLGQVSASAGPETTPSRDRILTHPEFQGAISAIDAWLEAERIYGQIPGLSVGIVHHQDLLWSRGYGYANLEKQVPADADTIYSVCSISKLFTSVGVMQLRDRGLLRLDDEVGKHLDWFDIRQGHEGSPPVTVEGLLTHSSGLPRESDFNYWAGPDFPFPDREQVMEKLGEQEMLYPAQQHFQYSNLALTLAGEIVQARSGQDYSDYVQQKIIEPLGLKDTRTHYPEQLRGGQLAIGYTGLHRNMEREPVAPFFTRGITPAAGFTSTVRDLARFASWQFRLLDSGKDEVLHPNTLREMHRVHWVDEDFQTTWGLGFAVRRQDDMTIVSHGGGCPGYITNFSMVPKDKLAVVVLTNAGDGPAGRLAQNVLKTIRPAIKAAANGEAETPAKDFSAYEGNFDVRPWGGEMAVRQWGDKLVVLDLPATGLDPSATTLEHDGEHAFTRLTPEGDRRESWIFQMGEDGKARAVKVHSFTLTRIQSGD